MTNQTSSQLHQTFRAIPVSERTFADAKRMARMMRIKLNSERDRNREGRFTISYFNGVDVAARPCVFGRYLDGCGSRWVEAAYDYNEAA